jgi:hypothetical protein
MEGQEHGLILRCAPHGGSDTPIINSSGKRAVPVFHRVSADGSAPADHDERTIEEFRDYCTSVAEKYGYVVSRRFSIRQS